MLQHAVAGIQCGPPDEWSTYRKLLLWKGYTRRFNLGLVRMMTFPERLSQSRILWLGLATGE